ncbi:hypothetical protein [Marinobacterium lutimaris]|uniref:Peptidase S24-like n=1 Tax=Marinobacterium lutimaris TaxID=568106 RepID=A0A1H5XSQ9_9GAMM|nr:hypothetical protein [Marinobacterium lutimaris]SEG14761.1 hypothetical protein SAMN05444390_1011491 [Marinobacterium lutimaris]
MEEVRNPPVLRLSLDDMVQAGVNPVSAREHRVVNGCTGVPVGAWVGVDAADQTPVPGDMYLIFRGCQHQVRYLWPEGSGYRLGRAPRDPTLWADGADVAVLGRVFWVGYVRQIPVKTTLAHVETGS